MICFLAHSGKNSKLSHSTTLNNNTTTSRAPTSKLISKLIDIECNLLRKNEGCFKCWKFFAEYITGQCTAWPDLNAYCTLTATDTMTAWTNYSNTTIAAITNLNSVDTTAIVAVRVISLLAATSRILRNDTDSSDNEYVNTPLFVPHLLWQALILNPNSHPSYILLHSTTMLINGGYPIVLICKDVASLFKHR